MKLFSVISPVQQNNLYLIVQCVRNPPGHVTPEKAKEQAEALYAAGM